MLEAQKEIRKLTEGKAQLKGEVEKLEAVNAEIKRENIKLGADIEKQEVTIENKNQAMLDWKKQCEHAQYDIEKLEAKLNETTEGHRIRIKGELEREFGVKIIELEKQLKLKTLDIDSLNEKVHKKEKEIQELRAKLKHKNTQLVEFNKFLMETIKKTKKEQEKEGGDSNDPMINLIKGKNKKVDVEAERADDVATLINQNKAILKELVKFKTMYSLLKDDHEYLKQNYEDSRAKKEKMAQELIETKGMYNEFKEQNMFYKRELDARTKELQVLQNEIKFLEQKLETSVKENENLYTVIKGIRGGEYDTNDVVSKMKDNVEAKIEENRQLILALELKDRQIKQLKKKLEENEITMSQAIDMSQYNTNVNKDIDFNDINEEKNMVPMTPAMTIGRDEKDMLVKKMEQLREHNRDLKTLLTAKTDELEKKEKALRRVKEELEAVQNLNKKGNEDNRMLDENLDSLQKVLKKRNKEIESLENQVGILQQRSREMGDKIELFEKENLKLRSESTDKDGALLQMETELREKVQRLKELGADS
jgi:predicted  nucleic acid-binding Zn-ribbon protein